MRFQKWHGIGNAYLVVERSELSVALSPKRVARICHPDLGAGSDGILVIERSGPGTAAVQILNPDGSEAEFSGNGTRIAAGYLMREDGVDRVELATLKGPISGVRRDGAITIDAGRAALESAADHLPGDGPPPADRYRFVSVGNPHCVIEVADPDALDLAQAGPRIEHHAWFPNRANVEFYRPLDRHRIRMRVWERGAGETLSSGSGSTAAAVAAVVDGRAESPVTVQLDGGDLVIEVSADLAVTLTGTVELVAEARFSSEFLTTLEALV
jgi:diaminopimelate epimerase